MMIARAVGPKIRLESITGFTLVETVIGLLLITMIAGGVLSVVLYGQRTSVSGEDRLAMMLLLEKKFIELKKNPSRLQVNKAYNASPEGTCVTADPCPATSAEYPVCPAYSTIDDVSTKLYKTQCFYYKIESLDSTLTGMPTNLKKVSGKIYWENVNGLKQSVTLETVMTAS